ncbi:MAG: SRPBCC family protein [Myxococcaceae bacterium]
MIRLTATTCIDASPARVWAVLATLEDISLWVPAIKHAHCPHARRGEGALRICELERFTVHETITAWDEGRSFTYEGVGAPMMKRARNTWSIEAHGTMTLVTSVAEVELKGGLFGRVLQPLVASVAQRAGARSLASLKHLVEHGKAFAGPGQLAPAPINC